MDKKIITEALERSNKWWKADFTIVFKPRDIYQDIKNFMHTRQIISLTGLRRVGKTTLLLKIVADNISRLGAKNIVYFSFDEFRDIKLREVLELYSKLMKKDLDKEKYLFLFDEIQKIENWSEQLKSIYDLNNNIKFIISGSESLFIRKISRESLAGRIFEFKIKPLSFKEYLNFKEKKFDNLDLYKKEILAEFDSFLLSNGFPEIINESEEIVEKYIKENVIEKILYKDIPSIVPIRNPLILEQVFNIILKSPGEIINVDDFAKELGISRQTTSVYLDYLEKSFLIRKLYNYSKNVRKTQRRLKKYYPCIIEPSSVNSGDGFGKVFEAFVVSGLDAEYFWRDAYKNEIDIIKVSDIVLPIEIKSGSFDGSDLKSIELFMDKYSLKKGLVITYDVDRKHGNIEAIPFYKHFLAEKTKRVIKYESSKE